MHLWRTLHPTAISTPQHDFSLHHAAVCPAKLNPLLPNNTHGSSLQRYIMASILRVKRIRMMCSNDVFMCQQGHPPPEPRPGPPRQGSGRPRRRRPAAFPQVRPCRLSHSHPACSWHHRLPVTWPQQRKPSPGRFVSTPGWPAMRLLMHSGETACRPVVPTCSMQPPKPWIHNCRRGWAAAAGHGVQCASAQAAGAAVLRRRMGRR